MVVIIFCVGEECFVIFECGFCKGNCYSYYFDFLDYKCK